MESIKDYSIATTFILVCSVSIIFWVIAYPSLNGQQTLLASDSAFNNTANNLTILLGNFQSQTNQEINVSTADQPTIGAESLQLVSTVSTSRTLMSRFTISFKLIVNLIANTLGLNSGTFLLISGAIISLFGITFLYFIVRLIRQGQ